MSLKYHKPSDVINPTVLMRERQKKKLINLAPKTQVQSVEARTGNQIF